MGSPPCTARKGRRRAWFPRRCGGTRDAGGDGRILAFARDRDVQYTQSSNTTERVTRIALRRGYVSVDFARTEETAIAIDPRGARGMLVVDVPRRPGATPRFPIVSEGDFGLRHEVTLEGSTQTIRRFPSNARCAGTPRCGTAALGEAILLRWQQFDIEQNLRRLPGGPGTLERLQGHARRVGEDVPGRADLAAVVEAMQNLRRLLNDARMKARAYHSADQALQRAARRRRTAPGPRAQEAHAAAERREPRGGAGRQRRRPGLGSVANARWWHCCSGGPDPAPRRSTALTALPAHPPLRRQNALSAGGSWGGTNAGSRRRTDHRRRHRPDGGHPDPRLREIMEAAVQHLHAFAREVRLTPEEWLQRIAFLTAVGQMCSPIRQEFVLLSDVLGLSRLVNVMHDAEGRGRRARRPACSAPSSGKTRPRSPRAAPSRTMRAARN